MPRVSVVVRTVIAPEVVATAPAKTRSSAVKRIAPAPATETVLPVVRIPELLTVKLESCVAPTAPPKVKSPRPAVIVSARDVLSLFTVEEKTIELSAKVPSVSMATFEPKIVAPVRLTICGPPPVSSTR